MLSRRVPFFIRAVIVAVTAPCLVAGCDSRESAPDRATTCRGYIEILSGRQQDSAAASVELQALAAQSSELVACGAVRGDSSALCKRFFPTEHGPTKMCLHMQAIFHELRHYPTGRSFLLDEIDWEEWQPLRSRAPAALDAFRDALRSGNTQRCADAGDLHSICRAYLTLDKSLCVIEGALADFEPPAPKKDQPTGGAKGLLEENCRQMIETRGFLAQGLPALAESGPPRERELAKAALGRPEACAAAADVALRACLDASR